MRYISLIPISFHTLIINLILHLYSNLRTATQMVWRFMYIFTMKRNIGMGIYTLLYTNECHFDCEKEFEAANDTQAISHALSMCEGNEGLWTGIHLLDTEGNEFEFNPF